MDEILGLLFIVILLFLYFLPTIIGFYRKKKNAGAIFALNLCLGWTFIGWVVALIWASTYEKQIRNNHDDDDDDNNDDDNNDDDDEEEYNDEEENN